MTLASARSHLVVPGHAARMLAKAAASAADAIVIDLEDAVPAAGKDAARATVCATAPELDWKGRSVSLRVNAFGSPWCEADLAAAAGLEQLHGIVLPKAERAADLHAVARLLDDAEADRRTAPPLHVQALVETATGLLAAGQIAAAGGRLDALVIGYADLAASLGRRTERFDPRAWDWAQETVLVAARAHGLLAIDGPQLDIHAEDALRDAARHASAKGFDGKWAIHPAQLGVLNDAFAPTPTELARARGLLDALAAAEREGRGATAWEGEMVDEAVRLHAQRLLARATALGLGEA